MADSSSSKPPTPKQKNKREKYELYYGHKETIKDVSKRSRVGASIKEGSDEPVLKDDKTDDKTDDKSQKKTEQISIEAEQKNKPTDPRLRNSDEKVYRPGRLPPSNTVIRPHRQVQKPPVPLPPGPVARGKK